MPRITKVYTKTGDGGETALADGSRVAKSSPRVVAYGEVDEVNSAVGLARTAGLVEGLDEVLGKVQNELFHLGSELSAPAAAGIPGELPRVEAEHVAYLERSMDALMTELPALENFVLPGGSAGGAALHLARAVCRRAERAVVALAAAETVRPEALAYLNRLSDWLFVAARYENRAAGAPDVLWDTGRDG